jgi:oligopeptide transport system substrate-binding protein
MLKNSFAALLVLLLLIGCKGDADRASSGDISKKDTLRINIGTEPPSLDCSLATDSTSYLILNNIMEGLARFGDDYKPEPALAEAWEVSADGKTYTFHIRKNVFWSDGKPLKAGDFEYSWKRILDPKTAGDYAYFLYDIENAEEFNTGKLANPEKVGVKAINDNILVVKLKHPAAYFPSLLTFMSTFPMRKDVVEKYGLKWTEPENILTLGPYSLSSWRHHEAILLTKNPRYWGEKPKVEFVKMIMNENPTSALALYESGELDYVDGSSIPVLEIPRLRLLPDFATQLQFRGNYIAFNVKKPPFDNPLVRKAFSAAIDRDSMVNLTQGAGIPATSWIPKGMLGYAPNIGITFNPDRAKAWLSEAGYPDGRGFPKVTFLYPDVTNNRIIAEALQSMWKKHLGVGVELSNQEWKVYLSTINTDPPEIHRAGWGADFPDPHNFMNLFECNSGNNRTQWCNHKYDELVEKAAQETDPEKRKELYDKAQEILTEGDTPIAPFLNSIQQSMAKPYVAGLKPNPLGIILFNKVHFVDNNKKTE